jgi:hypothetical protein
MMQQFPTIALLKQRLSWVLPCDREWVKIKIFSNFRICGLGFSAFASNEKTILSNRIVTLKRSIMFHPAASIKIIALLLILCTFALRLLYL